MMEKTHLGVYGMSISGHEKQRRDARIDSAKEKGYRDFFTPSYERFAKHRE